MNFIDSRSKIADQTKSTEIVCIAGYERPQDQGLRIRIPNNGWPRMRRKHTSERRVFKTAIKDILPHAGQAAESDVRTKGKGGRNLNST